jgi:hypothetical protein
MCLGFFNNTIMDQLPVEVYNIIFDFVSMGMLNRKQRWLRALSSMQTVNSFWNGLITFRLYKEVMVHGGNIGKFLRTLETTDVGELVQVLNIQYLYAISEEVLNRILDSCMNIREIRINDLDREDVLYKVLVSRDKSSKLQYFTECQILDNTNIYLQACLIYKDTLRRMMVNMEVGDDSVLNVLQQLDQFNSLESVTLSNASVQLQEFVELFNRFPPKLHEIEFDNMQCDEDGSHTFGHCIENVNLKIVKFVGNTDIPAIFFQCLMKKFACLEALNGAIYCSVADFDIVSFWASALGSLLRGLKNCDIGISIKSHIYCVVPRLLVFERDRLLQCEKKFGKMAFIEQMFRGVLTFSKIEIHMEESLHIKLLVAMSEDFLEKVGDIWSSIKWLNLDVLRIQCYRDGRVELGYLKRSTFVDIMIRKLVQDQVEAENLFTTYSDKNLVILKSLFYSGAIFNGMEMNLSGLLLREDHDTTDNIEVSKGYYRKLWF